MFPAAFEPVIYYGKVAGYVAKAVFQAQQLTPPQTLAQVQAAYQTWFANATSPAWWQSLGPSGEWQRLALYGLEAYGFFKVGEIIGRRHIIGYKLREPEGSHGAAGHH